MCIPKMDYLDAVKIPLESEFEINAAAFKYIHFNLYKKPLPNAKTAIFHCTNKSDNFEIGLVKWNPQWRKYCFHTYGSMGTIVFDEICCKDTGAFLALINKLHKKGKS
jgi:hypothetical protein